MLKYSASRRTVSNREGGLATEQAADIALGDAQDFSQLGLPQVSLIHQVGQDPVGWRGRYRVVAIFVNASGGHAAA